MVCAEPLARPSMSPDDSDPDPTCMTLCQAWPSWLQKCVPLLSAFSTVARDSFPSRAYSLVTAKRSGMNSAWMASFETPWSV